MPVGGIICNINKGDFLRGRLFLSSCSPISDVARYKLVTIEDMKSYIYDIVFEKEENGLWLLRSY